MWPSEKVTLKIRLGEDERPVEFIRDSINPNSLTAPRIFAARIGRGTKLHRTNGRATIFASVEEAKARGGQSILYATPLGVIALHLDVTLRRKPARIVGWASNYEGTNLGSKQRYHGRLD